MATMEEIRKKIKQGREALQLSQREFAKKLGVSASFICFLEKGSKKLKAKDVPFLQRLAELFQCDWHSLIPVPPEMPSFDQPAQLQNQKIITSEEIQKFIKQKRESLGMTQQELAKKIGVSTAQLSFWENGQREIKAKYEPYLKKMAELFGCDWRSLLPTLPDFPSYEPKQEDVQPIKTDSESEEYENKNLEEMKDPAMLTPLAKLLKAKVYVEVVQEKAVSGSVVKIRNKLTGDIAFRYLTSEMGCKLLKPIDKDYEVFPYEENGKFEILGVVNSVVVKKD